jgi:hypothetical protein
LKDVIKSAAGKNNADQQAIGRSTPIEFRSMKKERQSRSVSITRERERQRIALLSPVERALLALRLGRRARAYMALAGRK